MQGPGFLECRFFRVRVFRVQVFQGPGPGFRSSRSSEIRKYLENLKFGWRHKLNFRNETLAVAVKKHVKVDIKLFLSCPVLLDFSILFQIFCPGLWN